MIKRITPVLALSLSLVLGLLTCLPTAGGNAMNGDTLQEKILVAVDAEGSLPDATLYTLNPNGSVSAHPKSLDAPAGP